MKEKQKGAPGFGFKLFWYIQIQKLRICTVFNGIENFLEYNVILNIYIYNMVVKFIYKIHLQTPKK